MKALVTGSCGFIASHLVDRLIEGGAERVYCVDNLTTGRKENLAKARKMGADRVRLYVCSADNRAVMDRLVRESDIVYHLAARVGVDEVLRDAGGTLDEMHRCTQTVVDLCTMYQKRLLITSSSETYGRSEDVPFREDQDLQIGPPT